MDNQVVDTEVIGMQELIIYHASGQVILELKINTSKNKNRWSIDRY